MTYEQWYDISIHTFLAEGDLVQKKEVTVMDISIHTFLAEGDEAKEEVRRIIKYFNPHLPRGRRLDDEFYLTEDEAFQSTPSSRKATLNGARTAQRRAISIHTFLAEGD